MELEKLWASLANFSNAKRRASGPSGVYNDNVDPGHHPVSKSAHDNVAYGISQGWWLIIGFNRCAQIGDVDA